MLGNVFILWCDMNGLARGRFYSYSLWNNDK